MINVLLTGVGRRTYLINYFKEELRIVGGKVFASNSSPLAPALYEADEFIISPLAHDENYESFLLDFCKKNRIDLVISLFDIELPIISLLKTKFKNEGITIIVGDSWLIEMTNDKWKTYLFLKENGFNHVPIYTNLALAYEALKNNEIALPLFIKPRWGMGSIAVYKADNIEELNFYFRKVKREIGMSYLKYDSASDIENAVLIQPALKGEEYGLDIINDLDGNYCTTVVKKKLTMRSGETDAAEVVNEPLLVELGKTISSLTKHPSIMDTDVFFDGKTACVLELNPRFGGGYPFTHMSGVNLPRAIIEWHQNKNINVEKMLTPKIGVVSMKGVSLHIGNKIDTLN
jgi:carbamoyl-phosphate synthase large subunit